MRKIELNQGLFALVDDEDYERVAAYSWWVTGTGSSEHYQSVATVIAGKKVYLARFLVNPAAGMQVDHINGDCLDNRRANLRAVTAAVNSRNRRGRNIGGGATSKYKGVTFELGKWRAVLKTFGDTEEEAAIYYDELATAVFGSFARKNFGGRLTQAERAAEAFDQNEEFRSLIAQYRYAVVEGKAAEAADVLDALCRAAGVPPVNARHIA